MLNSTLRLFGLCGVHIWEMAQIFCSVSRLAQKNLFLLPKCILAATFHIQMSFQKLSLVCKTKLDLGGYKALCIFKLLLSHFVKFIIDKSSFVVLVSYFLTFP